MQNSGSPSNSLPVPEGFGKSGLSLTDAEVICSWMEPDYDSMDIDKIHWWGTQYHGGEPNGHWTYEPRELDLDACHEVETRLSDEQWGEYRGWFMVEHQMEGHRVPFGSYLLHADAPTKIRALAAILRRILNARPALSRERVLPKDDAEGTQACQEKRGQESKP